jgi:PAS domain S-box-containing protein
MSRIEPDLTRILASLSEGVWQRDLVTGEAWFSPRYKELLGFADDEMPNDSAAFAKRVHPNDLDSVLRMFETAAQTLKPGSVEGRMQTRRGEWRWFRAAARVWPDAEGNPLVLVGSVTDVHVEHQALLEIEALAERYHRAMTASSEADFELTSGVDDHFMSPRLPAMLGYPADTPGPTHDTFRDWVHPDDLPGLAKFEMRAAAGPGTWEYDFRLRQPDNTYRWIGARGRSELQGPGLLRMTGIMRDVDEQKRAELELSRNREQLQRMVEDRTSRLSAALELAESRRSAAERANLAKATFLAHMSHELRTPLNGVMGMTQLALRIASSDTQRRYLSLADQSGHSLLRILNDVLDFAKAEAGKLQLVSEPFDLPRLVTETVRSFLPQVGERPLHVLVDCIGEITHVAGDAGRVRQIVSNLVGNAIKFTERGAITVVVVIANAAAGACNVRIEVRDTGVGMDEETSQRVFEAFEQADSSSSRRHGGTGLGLPIVRLLAQMMKGHVQVQSTPGKGSKFTVDLTLATAAQPKAGAARAFAPGHAWLLYHSAHPARWMQRRLARLGWTSEVIDGIGAAIERLRRGGAAAAPRSIVVADEILAEARALAPLRQALPPEVSISLLLQPNFQLPLLHEAAAESDVHLAIEPLTAAELRELVQPELVAQAEVVATAPMALTAPMVLVVEDAEMNRLIVGEMIRVLGLRVTMASSGEEALRLCAASAPDLVLMDIQMPGMDGLETTRRLRALQGSDRLPHFPIVALTAHAMEADRRASMQAGIDEHVSKPIDIDRLRAVLARWIPSAGLSG